MKKIPSRYYLYSIVPLAALLLFVSNTASAHGWGWPKNADPEEMAQHQQEMFEHQAELLGTTADIVKDSWAKGQTLTDLADELGISETDLQAKMQANRQAAMKSRLQALVDQGIITQAQADQRYSFIEQNMGNEAPGRHMGKMMFGGGMGRFGP